MNQTPQEKVEQELGFRVGKSGGTARIGTDKWGYSGHDKELVALWNLAVRLQEEVDSLTERNDWFDKLIDDREIGTAKRPSLRAYVDEIEAKVADLERENAKLTKINELTQKMVDKWVPCPDHRDKTKELCYVCENEKLERKVKELTRDNVNSGTWEGE